MSVTIYSERGPGIGQLEPKGSLWDAGGANYFAFPVSESDVGRSFASAAGGAHGAVGAMVSESCCRPAEGHEQAPCRSDGAGLGTSGQGARCAVAVQEQPSSDLLYQMTRLETVVLRGEGHQPAEGCKADGYSGNGLDGLVIDRVGIIRGGRTGACCRNVASRNAHVSSPGTWLLQEGGEKMSTCSYCENRFAVSAGDAQRSGYHEIYSLNEALLSELCCISSRNESMQESLELDAFQEEWCVFDEEAIEDEVPHELVGVVDRNERVCYLDREVTSAQPTAYGELEASRSEGLPTVETSRLQRFVVECQQVDSCREVISARVFDPGGLMRVIVRCWRRFWESSKLFDHALYYTLLRLHHIPYCGRKGGEGGLCCSICAA